MSISLELELKMKKIVAKQEINEVTTAYCRGVDRVDEDLVRSCFHDESTMYSGVFDGDGHIFSKEICKILKDTFVQTFHSINNQWIEVDLNAKTAKVESYILAACTITNEENGFNEILTGGRYLDQFTNIDGNWKITERRFVMDWNLVQPSTRTLDAAENAIKAGHPMGSQDKNDPVYKLWH